MAKYTTLVRSICETKAGMTEAQGANNVDSIVSKAWNKIFTTQAPFFQEEHRAVVCKKILKHYYMREICAETVGLWSMWMNERLELVMPYYNQLYESELIEYNPLFDTDVTRTYNRNVDDTKDSTETRSDTSTLTRTVNGNRDSNTSGDTTSNSTETVDNARKDLYSDTPQGGIQGLEAGNYMTNARLVNDDNSTHGNTTVNSSTRSGEDYMESDDATNELTGNKSGNVTGNMKETYEQIVKGKQGGGSMSSMILKYRETFLNIDRMIVEEFEDLFMGLW